MQQFEIEPHADCYQHGVGASVSSIVLAAGDSCFGSNTPVDWQKWGSNLHHRHARNPRRSRVPARRLTPPRRHHIFSYGIICGAFAAVAVKPERESHLCGSPDARSGSKSLNFFPLCFFVPEVGSETELQAELNLPGRPESEHAGSDSYPGDVVSVSVGSVNISHASS
jgi:hypothetical protein